MMRRRVRDVMTAKVVSARRDTPYKELVRLLAERGVSGLPVLDDQDRVVGVVSEADLLVKPAHPANHFQRYFLQRKRDRLERAKAHGAVAAELMSYPAVTIGPDATVAEAARLLRKHLVKRLPVVDPQGRLLGIVSRGDVLKVFLRSDAELRREIRDEVLRRELLMSPDRFEVTVRAGVVVLQGSCERRSLVPVVVAAVRAVEGVVGVENRLGYDVDDLTTLPYTLSRPLP
jgi:CBS-domain-containing membrane protein